MYLKVLEIKDESVWERFFIDSGSPSFLQSWEWGNVQKNLGHNILRLAIYEKSKLKAVAQVIKIKAKRANFLFIPHGPIFSISNFKFQISNLLDHLIALAKKENFSFIRIAPVLEDRVEYQKIFQDLGFRTAPIYMHAERVWVLNLTSEVFPLRSSTSEVNKSDEQLLSQMRKTTRYLIKKAIRDGVVIEKRTDKKAIDDFYKIYEETAKRENFVPFSKNFIKCEFEAFNKTGNAIFLFGKIKKQATGVETSGFPTARSDFSSLPLVASTGGKDAETGPVAAALIIFSKSTAFYHQGASIHTKIPVTYLLQWEAIKEAKRRGCKFYNFWGIYQPGRTPKSWQGLSLFKTGFGGEQIDYVQTQDFIISPKYHFNYLYEKFLAWRRGV